MVCTHVDLLVLFSVGLVTVDTCFLLPGSPLVTTVVELEPDTEVLTLLHVRTTKPVGQTPRNNAVRVVYLCHRVDSKRFYSVLLEGSRLKKG